MSEADSSEPSGAETTRAERDRGQATFEEVYPRQEFSELIRLGLALGSWVRRMRDRRAVRSARADAKEPPSGPTANA